MYVQTLVKSEHEYQREMHRKLDRLQHDKQDIIRRRLFNENLFARGHLTKRHNWFNVDKTYRDSCRTMWNKQTKENNHRTSHVILPNIYQKENSSSIKNTFEIDVNDNSIIANEKIKQKFLHTQPVMVEILNAPHSYQVFKNRHDKELYGKNIQQQQIRIQKNAIDDQRYTQLISLLKDS